MERSLNDCQKGICDEPYIWAVGKLERLLEAKVKGKKGSIVFNSAKQPKSKKIIREEMLPDWFYELKEDERKEKEKEEGLKTIQKKLMEEQELEKRRRELKERLKNRRKQHQVL